MKAKKQGRFNWLFHVLANADNHEQKGVRQNHAGAVFRSTECDGRYLQQHDCPFFVCPGQDYAHA
jgi:hypothetical protein